MIIPPEELCSQCPTCNPDAYITVVTLRFLNMAKSMHESLKELDPDCLAEAWEKDIDDRIAEARRFKPTDP